MLRTKLIEAPRWGHIGLTRRLAIPAAAVAAVLVVTACGSSGNSGTSGPAANKKPITLLFGSSGPAETSAEKAAAAAFTKKTGIPVNVVAASNLQQQLAQDFAGNTPPNLFYLDPTSMQQYAAKGVLDDYGDSLPNAGDFYPSLKAAFTYHGKMYCAPKDAGALSLYINDADWSAAGLTSADYPTNWTQLATVAKKLTTGGRVGLVTDPNESRLDPFLYQAGGGIVNAAGTKAIMNTPANVQALTFLKSMLSAGSLAFPAKVNEQDEIPALGDNKAAMIISGPWMDGAMQTGFPNVSYSVHPLPAGPTGTKGTLVFTNCWGVPKQNSNLGGTIEFVKFLTTPDQELKFAKAFGALPSLKTMGATFTATFPKRSEELTAVQVGHPDIEIPGATNA
ncbi:MAG: extracellular solute-binding protein, partial [Actinobacteria bacterium]|nr:extracellular solute-binding protein [Actinomycetota bacterium]